MMDNLILKWTTDLDFTVIFTLIVASFPPWPTPCILKCLWLKKDPSCVCELAVMALVPMNKGKDLLMFEHPPVAGWWRTGPVLWRAPGRIRSVRWTGRRFQTSPRCRGGKTDARRCSILSGSPAVWSRLWAALWEPLESLWHNQQWKIHKIRGLLAFIDGALWDIKLWRIVVESIFTAVMMSWH